MAEAGSPAELEQVAPAGELRRGQRVRTEVRLSIPVAQAVGIAGVDVLAESLWQEFLAPEDVRVDRVFASDSFTVVMEGTVTGTPILAIVVAIAAVLAALGFLIVSIRFLATGESPSFLDFGNILPWLAVGAGALILIGGRR